MSDSDNNDYSLSSMLDRIGTTATSGNPGLVAALTAPNQNIHDRATVQRAFGLGTDVKKISKAFFGRR